MIRLRMEHRSGRLVGVCAAICAAIFLMAGGGAFAARSERPNVVVILIDDLGWSDVGCYGSRFYETPNIDRLAAEGVRFTDGYAASPVCSPTRAALMTGKYPARLHLTDFLVNRRFRPDSPILPAPYRHELPLEEVTIADALKPFGYTSAHIGKWHLGPEPYSPENQGFDINIGGTNSGMPASFFWPRWGDNPPIVGNFEGEYLPDRLAAEAVRFIEDHKDRPFFLHLSHYAVHIPLEAKQEMIRKYEEKPKPPGGQNNPIYAAMVESVDQSVGRVMDALARVGIDERTVVFFTSDNGGLSIGGRPNTPATCSAPLRAGKGQLYEGGIRVPFIVKWPGVTTAGTTCEVPVHSIDFFPTILEMAGADAVTTNGPIDGESIVPLLKGDGRLQRDALYWHYPHFSNQLERPGGAIRVGDLKLIERYEDGTVELYNLADDIGERSDLTLEMPDTARALRDRFRDWRQSVNANMPVPNPNYATVETDTER